MSTLNHKTYLKYSWFLVGMVFLVILAGGVVRMTQSGMGCPDWPRCFGMWIPPTDASQLPADFEKYLSKQDIDHSFNVYHTWIEYINRLLGALLGVFIFIYAIWTARKFSTHRSQLIKILLGIVGLTVLTVLSLVFGWSSVGIVLGIVFLLATLYSIYHAIRFSEKRSMVVVAVLLLIAVAIQGYLGKIVVDENLSVVKITIHMIGALVIAALPLVNIAKLKNNKVKVSRTISAVTIVMLILVLLQIVLGTQVREEIDIISKSLSYEQRELWIGRLGAIFVIHRSFSWIVLASCLFLYWKGKDNENYMPQIRSIGISIFIIILLGVIMSYADMPAIAQPLHLLLACVLLMQIFYSRLRMKSS